MRKIPTTLLLVLVHLEASLARNVRQCEMFAQINRLKNVSLYLACCCRHISNSHQIFQKPDIHASHLNFSVNAWRLKNVHLPASSATSCRSQMYASFAIAFRLAVATERD